MVVRTWPRDVRGFAVKLYTRQGNWDLVGNGPRSPSREPAPRRRSQLRRGPG